MNGLKMIAVVCMVMAAGTTWGQVTVVWEKTYGGEGGEVCFSLVQTRDGSYALAGCTNSFGAGGLDFWFLRTGGDGDSLWSATFGEGGPNDCRSLVQIGDGGFALGGITGSFDEGRVEFAIVRTTEAGDILWSKTYGDLENSLCNSVIQTSDGGFALAGSTAEFNVGTAEFWLMRTNEDGDSLWSRRFGGNENNSQCFSLIQTVDGGFALAGNRISLDIDGIDFWVLRTNEAGDSLWSRNFGGRSWDQCSSLIQTADGGFALAGVTGSFGSGSHDFWLVRTNADGDSLWSRTFGDARIESCTSLIEMEDGGFALAGETRSYGAGEKDFWLVRTNRDGDSLWSQTFGGGSTDECHSLIRTSDGGFALAGYTTSFGAGRSDFYVVKTSSDPPIFEATILDTIHDYPDTYIDSTIAYNIEFVNNGFRAGYLFSAQVVEGGGVFNCILDSALMIPHNDTAHLPITFTPSSDTSFVGQIRFHVGVEMISDTLSITLTGNGVRINIVSDPNVHICRFLQLSPIFPNPFNSSMTISFGLSKLAPTRIGIFDPFGRKIEELLPMQTFNAGRHSVMWNAAGVPAGEYIVRLEAGGSAEARRIVLTK